MNRPKPRTLNYGPNMEIELLEMRAKSLGMRADHLGCRGGWTWSCDSLRDRSRFSMEMPIQSSLVQFWRSSVSKTQETHIVGMHL